MAPLWQSLAFFSLWPGFHTSNIFCPDSFHCVFILIINKLRQDPTQAFIQIHIKNIKIRKMKSIVVTIMLPQSAYQSPYSGEAILFSHFMG